MRGAATVINWNYHSAISVAKRPKTKGQMSAYIQACLLKWDAMSAIFESDPRMKSMLRQKLLAPIMVAACCAWAVQAQTVGDDGAVPTTGLNLPANLATFGKVEPTVRKATAIVNGEIIT